MANPKNFLFHSDYPIDKILFTTQGSVTLKGESKEVRVPHGLPYIPLVLGSWSFDQNFENTYEFGYSILLDPSISQVACSTDSNDLVFTTSDVHAGKTIFYKIFGFPPTTYTGDFLSFNGDISGLNFNSDLNYLKLEKEGSVFVTNNGQAIINHDLGYKPFVFVWQDIEGRISRFNNSPIEFEGVNITDSSIIFKNPFEVNSGKDITYHYRIYIDE